MSQTAERASALDDFAKQAGNMPATVPVPSYIPPAEIMPHGAHALAVYRDESKVRTRIRTRAAEAGERFYYRWPVRNKKKGTTDWVEGPTIKAANALVNAYGNCRAYVAQVEDMGTHWRFRAVFIDFETGAELGRSFIQRKSGGTMGDDAERQRDIAYQIGESKALRNVIVNALESYADFAVEEAKNSMVDKIGKAIDRYRKVVPDKITSDWGVDIKRVEMIVGRPVAEWLAPDIARIIAMMNAIGDGMATVDETFPPLKTAEQDQLNKFASASAAAGAEAGAASSPSPPPGAAPAPTGEDAARLGVLLDDTIDTVLRIASRFNNSVQERLENLDLYLVPEAMMFYPDFVKALMKTAVKVAKEELTVEAARKYILALPVERKG
jgi:hypothetical protein